MGEQLIEELSLGTGLPQEMIRRELEQLIQMAGKEAGDITLEDIRKIMASYLQDVILEAREELS